MEPIKTMPVVADTVYVTFHAPLAPWMMRLLAYAEVHEGQKVYADPITAGEGCGAPCENREERAAWTAWKGRLSGYAAAYDYVIAGRGPWTDFRMLIGPPDERPGGAPWGQRWRKVRLMVGSSPLWRARGRGEGAYEVVKAALAALGNVDAADGWLEEVPPENLVTMSRLDLCCDHWGHRWELADLYRFACRQGRRGPAMLEDVAPEIVETPTGWAWSSRTGTTLYLGGRASRSVFLRIYDKVAEAQASGKLPWMEPIWREFGWEPGVQVWRAEIECGGEWLRKQGMPTLDLLRDAERPVWEWFTNRVRHTPGKTQQLRHEASSPVWTALQSAGTDRRRGEWRWQPRPPASKRDMVHLIKQAAGCLAAVEDEMVLSGALVPEKPRTPIPYNKRTRWWSTANSRRAVLKWAGAAMAAKRRKDERAVDLNIPPPSIDSAAAARARLDRLADQPSEHEDLYQEMTS